MRALIPWIVFSTAVVAATAMAACGGADDTNNLNGDPSGTGDPASGGDPATSSGGTSGGTSGALPAGDGDGGADADTGAPPATVDPFAGAAAFVSQTAPSTHNAGKDCLASCHSHGFTFGGTVFDGAGKGVAGAEVVLRDADGKATVVHTGPNGNFSSATAWKAPGYVGVRTASKQVVMVTPLKTLGDGACNTCHATTGTVSRVHIP